MIELSAEVRTGYYAVPPLKDAMLAGKRTFYDESTGGWWKIVKVTEFGPGHRAICKPIPTCQLCQNEGTIVVHPDMIGMDADPTVEGHDRIKIPCPDCKNI